MFILIQKEKDGEREKYFVSNSFNDLENYILSFEDVFKLNDFFYETKNLIFMIKLSEVI